MPITPGTMRAIRRAKININGVVDQTTRDLVTAWATAWDDLSEQWELAVTDLVAMSADGSWPSPWRIARAERIYRALAVTVGRLDELAAGAGATITGQLPLLTEQAAEWEARIIASQLPRQAGTRATLAARFSRVDGDSLDAIVTRTTEQINAALWPLTQDATTAMNTALVRGVAVGDNPRRAAALMVKNVEGAFNGGLTRALNIARTEMLDAHRAASWAQDQANQDVLTHWLWVATLDTRTCPSCLARHGTRYPIETPGPEDHQQGRCTRCPVTKTWRELGFNIDEPDSIFPDARAWFDDLPPGQQASIMGPTRLDLLQTWRISWDDLSTRRTTPQWRDSWGVAPVQTLQTIAYGGRS